MNYDNDTTDAEYEPDEPRKQERQVRRPRKRNAVVWAYFKDAGGKMARCIYCQNLLSHRSTITNLTLHLSKKHAQEVHNDIKFAKKPYISLYDRKRKLSHYDSYTREKRRSLQHSEPDGDSSPNNNTRESKDQTVNLSSEIWRHFEQDDDEAKCKLCEQSLPSKLEGMKNHLEDHHASILDEIISKVQTSQDAGSEAEFPEHDNMYTEVLYLEDESGNPLNYTPNKRIQPSRSESTFKNKAKIKDRRISTSPERPALKKQEPIQDELEVFLSYIRLLLKKVPKEASQQLHLDMISLIMKAQNNHRNQHNIVVETVAANNGSNSKNVAATLDNNIYLIRNKPSSNSAANATRVITVPIEHLVSGNNQNNESVGS